MYKQLVLGVALLIHSNIIFSAPVGSDAIQLTAPTPVMPQTQRDAFRQTQEYYSTDIQANAQLCPSPNQVMVGYAMTQGTSSDFTMSKNVHFNLTTSNYTNYTQTLMTSDGTRTIYCQGVSLGYPSP